ncbi:LOW QUALITY PROTEIN: calpain-2 catalytic subunit-like [Hippoglossus hippoglossus]|uniref:LOW QUALITY PROTEIN: calpain-2 catalytic subunit-like n=1 Tax=Hippoglossus hippoglossus TaxID=8267 RepID=UPI00148BB320|nr:LOW QUALITY PROTEIN: calpain-2 catalytic subunit-like [Hippoglossus hippoglossus]
MDDVYAVPSCDQTAHVFFQYSGKREVHLKGDFFQDNRSAARSETFVNLREVCGRCCLPPGEYLIIPSTFQPDENGDFYMRVFCEKGADFQEIDDPLDCHVEEIDTDEDDISDGFRKLFGQFAGHVSRLNILKCHRKGFQSVFL